MGEIIALTRMTGGEYDAARAAIGNRKDAKPKWDQELCKLFTASGWLMPRKKPIGSNLRRAAVPEGPKGRFKIPQKLVGRIRVRARRSSFGVPPPAPA